MWSLNPSPACPRWTEECRRWQICICCWCASSRRDLGLFPGRLSLPSWCQVLRRAAIPPLLIFLALPLIIFLKGWFCRGCGWCVSSLHRKCAFLERCFWSFTCLDILWASRCWCCRSTRFWGKELQGFRGLIDRGRPWFCCRVRVIA